MWSIHDSSHCTSNVFSCLFGTEQIGPTTTLQTYKLQYFLDPQTVVLTSMIPDENSVLQENPAFVLYALHSQRKGDLSMKDFLMKVKGYCDSLVSCGETMIQLLLIIPLRVPHVAEDVITCLALVFSANFVEKQGILLIVAIIDSSATHNLTHSASTMKQSTPYNGPGSVAKQNRPTELHGTGRYIQSNLYRQMIKQSLAISQSSIETCIPIHSDSVPNIAHIQLQNRVVFTLSKLSREVGTHRLTIAFDLP
ncbi:hypothetical protein J1N35_006341 [Gossypium stocksii]|uniref:Uncharacterized protein n=1 Tax=Gossypium stocksii TaxID=47602 RepID=A0A9D3WGP3_9ROSI|nr:hypothetical protein J1N35_006341 [Gossypium stocksii]